MKNCKDIYEKRKLKYERLLIKQKQTINFISILRLIIFAASGGFTVYFYIQKRYTYSVGALLIGLVGFIVLILKHSKVIKNKNLTEAVLNVNSISVKRLAGEWRNFLDNGEEFIDNEHNFSDDLDIFGKSSLFQWINSAHTPLGRITLKNRLSNPRLDKDIIIKTQQAVNELSDKIGFRQRVAGEGSIISTDNNKINELFTWAEKGNELILNNYLKVLILILPMASIITIILYLFLHIIGYSLPLVCIAINLCFYKIFEKQRIESLDTIYKYKKSLKVYYNMIKIIESRKFNSELLKELKSGLNGDKEKASEEINRLIKIAYKISDRSNFFSIIFNIILLWDFHLINLLESWKKDNGKKVKLWLQVLGEFEALSSLSLIRFDNPTWEFAKLKKDFFLQTNNAAHPLLASKAVSNSIVINSNSSIILITGSNMSGKSTFLRTLGINLVLAYAGAPVCASEFSCGLMNIYTCMRISDNLEKNISSFYAEIIRIKKIVTAVNNGEPVFFLLDEIFKGTNSLDRHMGAEALINMLSCENAIGLVSTHDLELGELEQKNSKVKNYNFQEYYKDNEIKFDYKLRTGISATRNAKFLMKLAGIEFKE